MKYRIETERADLFDVNIVIAMNVRLEMEVPFEMLEEAFYKACKCHEVLQSRIIIDESGEAFYVDNSEPQNSITKTELSYTELIYENERLRFRIEKGEYIRAFQSPDGLVFLMHHLGGDGKSLLYFIETFMKCLAGQECEYVPFRNLKLDDLPAECKLPFFYKLLIKSWNKGWAKDRKVFGFKEMDEAYNKFWKNNKSKVEIKRYEKADLKTMLKSAKAAGVSLTSYLITDMIKDTDSKLEIGLAVDGRQDSNRAMGNQVTGIAIKYGYDKRKSFEDNAKEVHNLLQTRLKNDRYRYFVLQFMGMLDMTMKDALNLDRAGYFRSKISSDVAEILGYGKKVRDISITNLTRADIALNYGEHTISEIVFVPPIVSYAKNVIGIITTDDVMYVTRHIYE